MSNQRDWVDKSFTKLFMTRIKFDRYLKLFLVGFGSTPFSLQGQNLDGLTVGTTKGGRFSRLKKQIENQPSNTN